MSVASTTSENLAITASSAAHSSTERDPSPSTRARAALSLMGDPLAEVARTDPDFDAFGFGPCQKLHSLKVDQLYLCEFDGDDAASVERGANDSACHGAEPVA